MKPKWIVLENTVADGWTNTWSDDGEPQTFDSYAEALAELGDLFQEVAAANKDGRMDSLYDPQNYRIEEVPPRPKYNHVFTIAFSVESCDHDGEGISNDDFHQALVKRSQDLTRNDEWDEAVGPPTDTYETGEGT